MSYEPSGGIQFFDAASQRLMKLVEEGDSKGWICYRHLDGMQWVTLREATDDDRHRLRCAAIAIKESYGPMNSDLLKCSTRQNDLIYKIIARIRREYWAYYMPDLVLYLDLLICSNAHGVSLDRILHLDGKTFWADIEWIYYNLDRGRGCFLIMPFGWMYEHGRRFCNCGAALPVGVYTCKPTT